MLHKHLEDFLYKNMKFAIADHKVDILKNLVCTSPAVLDDDRAPLLRIAVDFFHPEIMLILLQSKKFNINFRDDSGFTALSTALIAGNFAATKLLLQAGAVLDESHRKDKSAKSISIRKNPAIADLLEQLVQGKLGHLPTLSIAEPVSNVNADKPKLPLSEIEISSNQSSEVLISKAISGSDIKPVPLWKNITGSLKQRIRETNALSEIELASKSVEFPPKRPSNHLHAD